MAKISKSSIEKELRDEITSIKEDIASGDPDDDDWLSTLNYFRQHPEEIKKHISAAEADRVAYDESFFVEFFKNIQEQLTDEIVKEANVVIIRFSEAEIIHLDFHCLQPEEPATTEIPYGYQINGKEVSLYEIGKTSIVSADLYRHPIDVEEVFMSIGNEYFGEVMFLRMRRTLQAVYRKTRNYLVSSYEMKGYQFFIGDYHEVLWVE